MTRDSHVIELLFNFVIFSHLSLYYFYGKPAPPQSPPTIPVGNEVFPSAERTHGLCCSTPHALLHRPAQCGTPRVHVPTCVSALHLDPHLPCALLLLEQLDLAFPTYVVEGNL
jgi:hypothetical protein